MVKVLLSVLLEGGAYFDPSLQQCAAYFRPHSY